ncbi:MAG: hypothetical protein J3Q66DRAFT_194349 [Benniella sp.]|nr:MAG: hypothetical protein J3Q66DRAFT_194349 [Benniella sp.]
MKSKHKRTQERSSEIRWTPGEGPPKEKKGTTTTRQGDTFRIARRALKLGTVDACLRRNITKQQLSHDQALQAQTIMHDIVLMSNTLQTRLYQATALLVTRLTLSEADYGPSVTDADDNEPMLKSIKESKAFMNASRLFSASRRAAWYAYRLFISVTSLQPLVHQFGRIPATALSFVALPVYTSVRCHCENARFISMDADRSKSVIFKFFIANEMKVVINCMYEEEAFSSYFGTQQAGISQGLL